MRSTPNYVDLQVNGFGGVDFNAGDLSADEVIDMCSRLRADGVAGILATVITDDVERMCRRIESICRVREAAPIVADTIWGIHIEGPFLNEQPGYIGAHPATAARVASVDVMERLLDAGEGLVRIVTLAPERDPHFAVTRLLVSRGVRVSAGHCDPTLDQLQAAIDAGVNMFTHLGNGCPLMLHRHDNIIQRVLSVADRLWIGFIADGIHLPFPTLKNYLKLVGIDRSFVVTDAIHAAGLGPGTFSFGGQLVVVDEHRATWAVDRNHLVGSASRMKDMASHLRCAIGLSEKEIDLLTSENPRRLIAIETKSDINGLPTS